MLRHGGCGRLAALHGDLSGWLLLRRRRKKDGVVCKFGCQLHCGVNSSAATAALEWARGQFLRKCVLGERELCANVPGRVSSQEKPKPQLAQCLLFNKDDFFLLFINLNLVELDGVVWKWVV